MSKGSEPVSRKFINKTKLEFYKEIKLYQSSLKPTDEIEGVGSIPIVGEQNYPYLKVHNVSTVDKENSYVNSADVVKKDYSEIIKLKAKNILGSTDKGYIKQNNDRVNQEIVDIYKSKNVVEFNSKFEKELKFNKVLTDKVAGIMGSKNPLQAVDANENTSTSKQIEKHTAGDIKARESIIELYEKGVSEHQIMHLLALGTFGIQMNKKMVPTRWAISAYDQTIEKHLHSKIRNYKVMNEFEVYYYKNKSDTHVIVFLPDSFSCEHIEDWEATNIGKDYVGEDNKLNKESPSNGGEYYATKISTLELLEKRKKQASIIAIRTIRNYDLALGVVFVRECVRNCLKNRVFKTTDFKDLQDYLQDNFPVHYRHFLDSKVLSERKKQKKLGEFF